MARFIISHRLAGKTSESAQEESRASLEKAAKTFSAFSTVESVHEPKGQSARMTVVVDSDPVDIEAKRKELSNDVMVEPEVLRQPAALMHDLEYALPMTEAISAGGGAGIGATLELTITSLGTPVPGVKVNLMLKGLVQGQSTMVPATTDNQGKTSIAYNPGQWLPSVAIVVPKEGLWSWWQNNPQNQMVIDIAPLPKSGPVAWWHQIMGINQYSEKRGEGVKVGIADTGIGPNPYVSHVKSIGAFINGSHDKKASAGLDSADHGTHVAGIIGARPPASSGEFMGMAPGAELFMARVFSTPAEVAQGASRGANQGDIANAMDSLSTNSQVDLINLSLGGPTPSQIELDAIQTAIESGTLVLAAAGNSNGAPVMYPAAYRQAVAVSAIGVIGTVPVGSLAAASVPSAPDHFATAAQGMYLANFSNVGPQIGCTGPGVGIVSTVPGRTATDPAYADMSGTSMATPAVCGRLAALLSSDPNYLQSKRDASRALAAWMMLAQNLHPLGLSPSYEGGGLPFVLTP